MNTCKRDNCEYGATKAGWCNRHYKHQLMLGNGGRVPSGPAVEHAQMLVAAGATVTGIARTAGLPTSTVSKLLGNPGALVIKKTAERVLAVTPEACIVSVSMVATLGPRRRYEAMLRVGHHSLDIAAATGVSRGWLLRFLAQGLMPGPLAAKVDELYRDLAFRPGSSPATTARAKMLGYHSALAWDDIDDPNEKPSLGTKYAKRGNEVDQSCVDQALSGRRKFEGLTRAEAAVVVRVLATQRFWADGRIAEYLGTTDRTVIRIRQRAGIPAVPVGRQLDAA